MEREQSLMAFAKSINIHFKDIELLNAALTHRSYLNESKKDNVLNNERLEFLGDAVLELIVSEYLFGAYIDRPEGELTSFRAATVKTDSLAEESRKINIGEYLQMSKGEETTGGKDKDYLLANAFEAVLGAIYLDQGYDVCKKFLNEGLLKKIPNIVKNRLDIDAKTKFQEISQSIFKITPKYQLIKEEGPDHEKIFTMAVMVGDKEYGRGDGNSKQRAEESAAEKGLEMLHKMDSLSKIA